MDHGMRDALSGFDGHHIKLDRSLLSFLPHSLPSRTRFFCRACSRLSLRAENPVFCHRSCRALLKFGLSCSNRSDYMDSSTSHMPLPHMEAGATMQLGPSMGQNMGQGAPCLGVCVFVSTPPRLYKLKALPGPWGSSALVTSNSMIIKAPPQGDPWAASSASSPPGQQSPDTRMCIQAGV